MEPQPGDKPRGYNPAKPLAVAFTLDEARELSKVARYGLRLAIIADGDQPSPQSVSLAAAVVKLESTNPVLQER